MRIKINTTLGILIVSILGITIGIVGSFYYFEKNLLKKIIQPSIQPSLQRGPSKKNLFLSPQQLEEVRKKMNELKKECKERITKHSLEELVKIDPIQAENLAICKAVKEKNLKICDSLKYNPQIYEKCLKSWGWNEVIFPLFSLKRCESELIEKGKKLGVEEIDKMCKGILENDKTACEEISHLENKAICLAIAQSDVKICETLLSIEDEVTNCKDMFYLVKSVKEGDKNYLRNIKEGINFAMANIFFNEKGTCEEWLSSFNEKYCENFYSEEYIIKEFQPTLQR